MAIPANAELLNLRRRVMAKAYDYLNERQREAVFQVRGPVLILAGAGSGKTTVLVSRVANMVRYGDAYRSPYFLRQPEEQEVRLLERYLKEGVWDERIPDILAIDRVEPWRIMAITFTNKAAGELKERLHKMLGGPAEEIAAGTFHATCVRILRRNIERLGYKSAFSIYDQDDAMRIIRETLREGNIDDKLFPPRSVLSEIGRAKDALMSPQDYAKAVEGDHRRTVIAKVYARYQERLRAADAVDFDDIIALTVRLFRECPDVLEYYQNRYRYILVDEYQDTNHAQYQFVSLLAARHQNLCVVGDDDQSIYKFRGATIENILGFEREFDGCTVVRLEQNYRSTQMILNAANAVIANNTQRKGKNLWTAGAEGEKILFYTAQNEGGEAEFIAHTIEKGVAAGRKYGDHAILYRMNAQSNPIETYFAKAGIPYRIIGGLRFYERKEIKDITCYLSLIVNPDDDLRLRRIINEPRRGIGDATVAAVEQLARAEGVSMLEIIRRADRYPDLARRSKGLLQFGALMEELAALAEEAPPDKVLEAVLDRSGYLDMLLHQGEEGRTRIENLQEMQSNILRYEEDNPDASLASFLEEVALVSDIDSYDADADAVVMMTLHSAKGLEFPVVFLVGMEEGIFPGVQSQFSPEAIEEERRLMYVGVTRAREALYLTRATTRMLFGQTQRNRPSRFVSEIPSGCKSIEDATVTLLHEKPQKPGRVPVDYSQSRRIGVSAGMGGPSKPAPAVGLKVGARVSHKVFGEGMILSAKPMGNDTLLEIAFDKVGTKKIMQNFAKLTPLD